MTQEEKERILSAVKGKDASEVVCLLMENGNTYSRRLLKFVQWVAKWVPIVIMLWHCFAMWDFSHNPRETFIYFMLYLLPVILIAFSELFCLCWVYRIPFFYFFGVNSIHITFGSWYTTNEMVGASLSVIVMTVFFYAYWLIKRFLTDTRIGRRIFAVETRDRQKQKGKRDEDDV